MITHVAQYPEEVIPAKLTLSTPSGLLEYSYYLSLFYAIMGEALGLPASNLGSGILAVLLGWCLLELRSRVPTVIGLVAFPLGCGISYLYIQVFLHEESLMGAYVLPFLQWVFALVIVQSLSLRRDFLHRFALFTFFIGLAWLPYAVTNYSPANPYQRFRLDSAVGYANPNNMAAWYGFCVVYFTMLGYITRRNADRILSWLIAVGCLYMVTLTVSRGALFAVAIAIVVASRHLLKSGFLPILLFACLSWILIELGVFDQAIRFYGARGMEETGRLVVWPLIVERFLDSPLIGVGASRTGALTYTGTFVTPHNGFLLLAQASGIIPCALFVAYWLRAAWAALHANVRSSPDSVFHIPLLIYTFLIVSLGNLNFMTPWAIVSLAVALTGAHRSQALDTEALQSGIREKVVRSE